MKKLTNIGINAYIDPDGHGWARVGRAPRLSWKKLLDEAGAPITKRRAICAAALAATKPERKDNFAPVADQYILAGCPTKKHSWQPGQDSFIEDETRHINRLKSYFAELPATKRQIAEIDPAGLVDYFTWLMKSFPEGRGGAAYRKDVQTLSNVLNFAVFRTRQLRFNPIRSNRPISYRIKSRSRARMPESADVIHQQADYFFQTVKSEVFGWMTLFQMRIGVRTSELRRFRTDAKKVNEDFFEAGLITNDRLYFGRRSKEGINPWIAIEDDLAEMLECFHNWHHKRFPRSKWYFPGVLGTHPIGAESHCHALTRANRALGLKHLTPHGLRAFFATKHLRDGKTHAEVAALVGDKTASLMNTTYADAGGPKLTWRPSQGLPAWKRWQSAAQKVVNLR